MNCPQCQTELRAVAVRGVNPGRGASIGVCDLCRGVWLDRDHLAQVVDLDDAQFQALCGEIAPDACVSAAPDRRHGAPGHEAPGHEAPGHEAPGHEAPGHGAPACPRCGTPLQATVYCGDSGVTVNNCPRCGGNWLHAGKIARLVDYRRRSRMPPPPEQAKLIEAKLRQIEDDFRERDEEMIAGLVKLDMQPGMRGLPGKILHSMYRLFHRMGL